jgi:polar amino acid transport system substrate-binding protein
MQSRFGVALLALLATLVVSCTGPRASSSSPTPAAPPLRVGTSGDTPPYALRRDGQLVGLEIDLANALGQALGRRVDIVDLSWDRLFGALLDHQVDMVMDGVTVTPEREVRVAFGKPYLETGMAVLIRREDAKRYSSRDIACRSPIDVGVVGGTTGEKQLRERCPAMVARVYPSAPAAVGELRRRRIDAVVDDGPVLQWLQSQYDADLQISPMRIAEQRLAWAFRPDDTTLRARADEALASMRADGTLARILARWIPSRQSGRAE